MTGILMGNVKGIAVIDKTFDPASVSANTSAEQDVTVTGVKLGDMVFVNLQTASAGLSTGGARVKAADTISITFVNSTASPINASSATYRLLIVRPEVTGATSFAF